jgi:hypothetical protein
VCGGCGSIFNFRSRRGLRHRFISLGKQNREVILADELDLGAFFEQNARFPNTGISRPRESNPIVAEGEGDLRVVRVSRQR